MNLRLIRNRAEATTGSSCSSLHWALSEEAGGSEGHQADVQLPQGQPGLQHHCSPDPSLLAALAGGGSGAAGPLPFPGQTAAAILCQVTVSLSNSCERGDKRGAVTTEQFS